ncbi:MAG: hypothetical protein ACREMB_28480 [Candidatus Rokuibacteriota bacterium]
MDANRFGPIDATRRAWQRRWRDALLWTAGLSLAAVLMRLVARRVSRTG